MKFFNLNNYILVNITEYGWEHLLKDSGQNYITHCILPYKQTIDGVDYYKLQAHQVITLWGNACWMTTPCPLSMTILIPE